MGFLRDWWHRLRGAGDEPPHAAAPRPQHTRHPGHAHEPPAGRWQLQDRPPPPRPGHPGQAGFDPYGNDAGYAKPHGWERIDHD